MRAPGMRPPPPGFKFFFLLFSCSFWDKLAKIIGWRSHLCSWRPLLLEILDPPLKNWLFSIHRRFLWRKHIDVTCRKWDGSRKLISWSTEYLRDEPNDQYQVTPSPSTIITFLKMSAIFRNSFCSFHIRTEFWPKKYEKVLSTFHGKYFHKKRERSDDSIQPLTELSC